MTLYINVAKDFTPIPIGRLRRENNKSAEEFREDILYPKFCDHVRTHTTNLRKHNLEKMTLYLMLCTRAYSYLLYGENII